MKKKESLRENWKSVTQILSSSCVDQISLGQRHTVIPLTDIHTELPIIAPKCQRRFSQLTTTLSRGCNNAISSRQRMIFSCNTTSRYIWIAVLEHIHIWLSIIPIDLLLTNDRYSHMVTLQLTYCQQLTHIHTWLSMIALPQAFL